jgi:predicted nucleotidyltransferase
MKQVTVELLNEITSRIVERVHPEKVILFGSYAWGTPGESSDIDLFVILPHSEEPSYRRARAIYRSLRGIGVPIDVIVQTHDEVERAKGVTTSLARNVLQKGKVLYG